MKRPTAELTSDNRLLVVVVEAGPVLSRFGPASLPGHDDLVDAQHSDGCRGRELDGRVLGKVGVDNAVRGVARRVGQSPPLALRAPVVEPLRVRVRKERSRSRSTPRSARPQSSCRPGARRAGWPAFRRPWRPSSRRAPWAPSRAHRRSA